MAVTERIVVDVEPEVKQRLVKVSEVTGKPMKRIIVDKVNEEYSKLELSQEY